MLAGFLQAVAMTESNTIQSAVIAAVLRLAAVFIIVSFVVTSMVREANDKGLELILALPLPRASYFFGKLAGFFVVAIVLALLFGLPLALFALLWWFSARPRPRMQVSALFLLGYGAFRFIAEFARARERARVAADVAATVVTEIETVA